ncbi:enoyl-CoA hydratase/isomerase family protein [Flavobacteriaceae bacterium]|nr:enoyl-CoA hydratase/isomerase family protein [Flavobacteriaceae bacterium]
MPKPYAKQTIKNNISFIEFYHPSHNSLPGDILQKLVNLIKNAGDNKDIKVIVLQSGGDRTFCAGASFKELVNISDEDSGKTFFSGFANVINAMRICPKLIIGRIQGKTVGGGVGIIAACDYCLATKYAEIKLSELNIGIGPFVIGPVIERKIGLSSLSQISLNPSKFFTTSWAKDNGLYAEVFENISQLDLAVQAFAEELCSFNQEAVNEIKKLFWRGTDHWDTLLEEQAIISGRLVLSSFTKEKLNKFK